MTIIIKFRDEFQLLTKRPIHLGYINNGAMTPYTIWKNRMKLRCPIPPFHMRLFQRRYKAPRDIERQMKIESDMFKFLVTIEGDE